MQSPSVLVHEYVSGGSWPEPQLPAELAAEGRAMLDAVLADLHNWGRVHVTATCDPRMADRPLLADRVETLSPVSSSKRLRVLATRADAVLLIAPESGGVLERLTALVESAGTPLLGSTAMAVHVAADKWQCYQLFEKSGMRTPPTRAGWLEEPAEAARELGYPLVVKPRNGAGCEGVSLVDAPRDLGAALVRAGRQPLLQRFVDGQPASVSLLVCAAGARALSLNGQDIELGSTLHYRGGRVPLDHPQAAAALSLAEQAVALIAGLRGYVGVDLVLSVKGPVLIEINPRLTTAYVGLHRVARANLAELLWQAAMENRLPQRLDLRGTAAFQKDGSDA